jgi:hypothetical protein
VKNHRFNILAVSALVLALVFWPLVGSAASNRHASPHVDGPEAGARTYAQNYRDMVLAICVADAYANDKDAGKDVGSSVSAFDEYWTEFDMDESIDAVGPLVHTYLARDYFNPLFEVDVKGVRFDFLKCLDLYHSKDLDALVKRVVIHPNRTYRQDKAHPLPAKPKSEPPVDSTVSDPHPSPHVGGPEAGARTYAQNYRDMVLAACVANAYKNDKDVVKDAASSSRALLDWTYFDMDKSTDALWPLVDAYLARDYFNPLVEAEVKGVRFDFLKCLDLYHSKALDALVKRVVIHPNHTYRQDYPPPAKPK